MATIKWSTPEALTTALSTELDSLANSTSDTTGWSAASAAITNETDLYQYIELELVIAAQAVARSAGAFVAVYIDYSSDGTNYDDTANKAFAELLAVFPLDAATTARRLSKTNLPIAPLNFKLLVLNASGQALATGNTLKFRRYNEQVV